MDGLPLLGEGVRAELCHGRRLGITMSFQFGTNWPGFMETVGNIAGPLLAYEILTAFFLEAVFLGIMLFGFRRVPGWLHTLATFLVAFGTTMATFWIIVLNSWMHTPQGFEMIDGVAHATDWWEIVFNPSMPYRFAHMVLASFLTVAFLMAGVSAYRWLVGDRSREVRAMLQDRRRHRRDADPAADLHGRHARPEHAGAPAAKVAAMEGNWETGPNVPLLLFALPDEEPRANRFEIGVPSGASLILKHHADGVVPGLNDFVAEEGDVDASAGDARVLVRSASWSSTGIAMLALSWADRVLHVAPPRPARGRHQGPLDGGRGPAEPLLWALVPMAFSGWLATLAGWYTTEIGRQPWLVQGVMTTEWPSPTSRRRWCWARWSPTSRSMRRC